MPPYWWVVPAAVAAYVAVCILAVWLNLHTAHRLDVQVFPEGNPNLPPDWAQRTDLHGEGCYCDPCWVVKVRETAARQAAEIDDGRTR